MSIQLQQKKMRIIHSLISQDLGYIYGDNEDGPNGAKKQFHSISRAFLQTLGNDLGFKEFKVINNHGGIAVPGDIILLGMWNEGNGLYFQIEQPFILYDGLMYRTIKDMNDFVGGKNQWLSCETFMKGDYEGLVKMLSVLRDQSSRVTVCAA